MLSIRASLAVLAAAAAAGAWTTCDVVKDCGADASNRTVSTAAIQKCISMCLLGGTVVIPAGAALRTGSLNLTGLQDVVFEFGAGAHLHAEADQAMYALEPDLPPGPGLQYRAVLAGNAIRNLTIRGPTSAIIDGNGWDWWANFSKGVLVHQRPKLLELWDAQGVVVEGLTFRNSPFWTLHPIYSSDFVFRGVTVLAPRAVGNTDGIDPDSTSNVLIDSCHIDVGDDGISVKSTFRRNGTLVPASNITILNTTVLSRNVAIGSACFGNVTDVLMRGGRIGDDGNAQGIGSSPWAVKIKTHSPNGGVVRNITFDGVRFGRITPNPWQQPHGGMAISMYETYGCERGACLASGPTPPATVLEDITFSNIAVTYAVFPADITGEAASPIRNLTFANFTIAETKSPEWRCGEVTGTTIVQPVIPPPGDRCI